ncbi:four helix bundle protein [Verrucomicrobiota bacterium]
MTQSGLERFGAYQKSLELFDLVVDDMVLLQKDTRCYRLISQQVGSVDSICANIEEGYGRLSRREYVRFLDFARGSARETQGRYGRMKHWLSQDVIDHRVALCGEIIGILTSTIKRLQTDTGPSAGKDPRRSVREAGVEYGEEADPLDTRHSTLETKRR